MNRRERRSPEVGMARKPGVANANRRFGRRDGKPRIVVDMTADLFHAGHVSFLQKVRARFPTAHVTVWLQTDEQIVRFKGRPSVIEYAGRKAVLEACRLVDRVVQSPDEFTSEMLAPFDHLCHGDDLFGWSDEIQERYYGAARREDKLVTVPYTKGISTTDLIDRCKKKS